MAVDGIVYDLTNYCVHHPGGWFDLSKAVGDDGTDLYKEFHGWLKASGFVGKFQVGRLKPQKKVKKGIKKDVVASTKRLHRSWVPITLERVVEVGEFTHLFSFSIQDKGISLPVLWQKICPFHVLLRTTYNAKFVVRPLSPLNVAENLPEELLPLRHFSLDRTQLHLVIKLYGKGHLSKVLAKTKVKDKFHCAFVFSHLKFTKTSLAIEGMRGSNKFQGPFKQIGFIAAGTGVLPVLQVIQYLLFQAEETDISLVYSSSTFEAFLCLPFLLELAQKNLLKISLICTEFSKDQLKATQSDSVICYEGKFDKDFLKTNPTALPKPISDEDESVRLLICGPPGYEEYGPRDNKKYVSIRKLLMRNGWSSESFENFN